MMTAQELLEQNGIRLQSYVPGEHSTTCPECSAKRKRENQKKECLSVKIDGAGATWCCHHCGWTGPEKGPPTNGKGGNGAGKTYVYHAADGTPSFRKVRGYDKNGKKFFWMEQPDGKSGWIKGTNGVDTKILYRLPEVIKAIATGLDIACVEGEKDADRMWSIGIPATCNAHGAADPTKNQRSKWKREHSEQLRGGKLVVIPDHDDAGYWHAETTSKLSLGVAKRVRHLTLHEHWPDCPKGGDVSDYLDAGHSVEELKTLLKQAPEYTEPEPPEPKPTKDEYMRGQTDLNCNVGNVLLALEREPEIMNAFAYDEMLRTEVLLRPLFSNDPSFVPRAVTDADVTAIQAHLQWFGFRRLGMGATHAAVDKHAREHSFHPVRDYLNGLRWDGKGRLRTWLVDYLGAEQNDYTEGIGAMFLIGMVARILKPGCKLDYMIVLEGEQGTLKSTACAILAGRYFSDQLPDITSKEAFQHLRGKWLIEVAELRAYSRAAIDHFKEFLVRDVERYRPPWGRKEVHEPRQCCFVGTTNKSLYLKDETGNRRFWPVKTGEIKIEKLRQARDQLFAEALELFRAGVPWWPDAEFEQRCIAPEQEARYEPDVWEKPIAEYLARVPEGDLLQPKRTTILDIAIYALDYEEERPTSKDEPRGTPINRLNPKDQQRISGILTHLEWEPKRNRDERWWQPKPKDKRRNADDDAMTAESPNFRGDSSKLSR